MRIKKAVRFIRAAFCFVSTRLIENILAMGILHYEHSSLFFFEDSLILHKNTRYKMSYTEVIAAVYVEWIKNVESEDCF